MIKDLGELHPPLLVFGGVYSNYQALTAFKEIAERDNISSEQIICTGDIVGYCAQPEESVQLIRKWGIHSIAGNVEIQLSEESSFCGCNFSEGSRCDGFSKVWYPYAQSELSQESLDWMKILPHHIRFTMANRSFMVVHGSYTSVSRFIFGSTPWSIKEREFQATDADVILAGHCGLPFHHIDHDKSWVNGGVIGMPANDASPKVWYLRIDTVRDQIRFTHQSLEYDFNTTANLMEERGLSKEYSTTLRTGLWDNCEILPLEETAQSGHPLKLETILI